MPPFEVPDGHLPVIEQHLAEASAMNAAFKVHLRGTGTFRPVARGVRDRGRGHLRLRAARGPCGAGWPATCSSPTTRTSPSPTTSTTRRWTAFEDLADFECAFEADRFSLYVHDVEAGWVPTRDHPLTAAADA